MINVVVPLVRDSAFSIEVEFAMTDLSVDGVKIFDRSVFLVSDLKTIEITSAFSAEYLESLDNAAIAAFFREGHSELHMDHKRSTSLHDAIGARHDFPRVH
jgi:hypothetical protein